MECEAPLEHACVLSSCPALASLIAPVPQQSSAGAKCSVGHPAGQAAASLVWSKARPLSSPCPCPALACTWRLRPRSQTLHGCLQRPHALPPLTAAASCRPHGAPPQGWAELLADVLHQVAHAAQELPPPMQWRGIVPVQPDLPVLLRDVLSAAATCTAWRRALASPDLDSLTIGGAT